MNLFEKWWYGWWFHHCPKWLLPLFYIPSDTLKVMDVLEEKVEQLFYDITCMKGESVND